MNLYVLGPGMDVRFCYFWPEKLFDFGWFILHLRNGTRTFFLDDHFVLCIIVL